jgi:hypothetical protein
MPIGHGTKLNNACFERKLDTQLTGRDRIADGVNITLSMTSHGRAYMLALLLLLLPCGKSRCIV